MKPIDVDRAGVCDPTRQCCRGIGEGIQRLSESGRWSHNAVPLAFHVKRRAAAGDFVHAEGRPRHAEEIEQPSDLAIVGREIRAAQQEGALQFRHGSSPSGGADPSSERSRATASHDRVRARSTWASTPSSRRSAAGWRNAESSRSSSFRGSRSLPTQTDAHIHRATADTGPSRPSSDGRVAGCGRLETCRSCR